MSIISVFLYNDVLMVPSKGNNSTYFVMNWKDEWIIEWLVDKTKDYKKKTYCAQVQRVKTADCQCYNDQK